MFRKSILLINRTASRGLSHASTYLNTVNRYPKYWNRQIVFTRNFCQKKDDETSKNKPPSELSEDSEDADSSSQKRSFISAFRAMNEYLLRPADLNSLRKIHRRSPFYNSPPIVVYLRSDVEKKALQIWGNLEALQKEQRSQKRMPKDDEQGILIGQFLGEYGRSDDTNTEDTMQQKALHGTKRVVRTAIAINGLNFAFKTTAWLYSGSHSMFAEAVHSLADTFNQIILAFGIRWSTQQANFAHPYGFHSLRYVSSLISGCGIFFLGTGLSLYHGVTGLLHPHEIENLFWAYFVLGGSLLSEGGTLLIAYNETRKAAKRDDVSILQYVLSGQDPSINVVLLEDTAAVLGVGIAGTCMCLASFYGNPIFDAVGSLLVGTLLGCVASFVVVTNATALVGRSIPVHRIMKISRDLENDHMVRAIHDVKATDMGNAYVRYKAEIDFDGRELTRSYLANQNVASILEEVRKLKTEKDMEKFILKHGENIVDLLGAEVDRIEKVIKKKYPEVRHVDLEVL